MKNQNASSVQDEISHFLCRLAMERCLVCLAHLRAILHALSGDNYVLFQAVQDVMVSMEKELKAGRGLLP